MLLSALVYAHCDRAALTRTRSLWEIALAPGPAVSAFVSRAGGVAIIYQLGEGLGDGQFPGWTHEVQKSAALGSRCPQARNAPRNRMTRQFSYRKSCNGIEVRLRINPGDNSWLTIERPGVREREREYVDIKESDVDAVMERFGAINRDPQRFAEFVQSVSERPTIAPESL